MKKLLNTLYVVNEEAYLTLDGENIVVNVNGKILGRVPLHTLEAIICFSYKGASPALMGACLQRGVGLSFFLPNGRFQASIDGWEQGNVLLRKEQYRISDDLEQSFYYAQNMILGKVFNGRWCLERTLRDHKMRVDSEKISAAYFACKADNVHRLFYRYYFGNNIQKFFRDILFDYGFICFINNNR